MHSFEWPFTHPKVNLFNHLSTPESSHLTIFESMNIYLHPSIHPCMHPTFHPHAHPFIHPVIHPSTRDIGLIEYFLRKITHFLSEVESWNWKNRGRIQFSGGPPWPLRHYDRQTNLPPSSQKETRSVAHSDTSGHIQPYRKTGRQADRLTGPESETEEDTQRDIETFAETETS